MDANEESGDDGEESSNGDEAEVEYGMESGKVATIDDIIAAEEKSRDFDNNEDKYQLVAKVNMHKSLRRFWQGVIKGFNAKHDRMSRMIGRSDELLGCLSQDDQDVCINFLVVSLPC
jgi:hypothetical protein